MTDLSSFEVSATNNPNRQVSATKWNNLLDAIETAVDAKGDVAKADTRAALQALTGTAKAGRWLAEAGREGLFQFDDSDLSAEVAADTAQGLYVPPASDATGASGAWVRKFVGSMSPEWFGAAGDGATDDYAAFVGMIALINHLGASAVSMGRGKTYYIGQYRTAANSVDCIEFEGLNGLTIDGNGAKIDFKGDFDRDASTTTGIGFRFDDITGLVIRNLEIDGNVEETTNSSNSTENTRATGLRIGACTGVVVENVHVHHFASDGIMVASAAGVEASPGVLRASRNILLSNCRSLYNSRQALTVKEVENFRAVNCDFSYTAKHGGTYGVSGNIGHAPKMGFDFEPTSTASGDGLLDIDPNNVAFENCRFVDNLGGIWGAANEVGTSNLRFIGCVGQDPSDGTKTAPILLGIPGIVIRDCDIDVGRGRIELEGAGGLATYLIENNVIRGNCSAAGSFLLYDGSVASAGTLIRNNRLICTATATAAVAPVRLQQSETVFENNYIFIPKEAYGDEGAGDGDQAFTLNGAKRASGNTWETDLLAASGSGGTAHFYGNYGTMPVTDEKFVGTAPGAADTFRPSAGSTFDTTELYSANRVVRVADEAYGPGWQASEDVPTKNAVYDKIEGLDLTGGWTTVALGSDFTTTSATIVDVTGLGFAPAANTTYEIEGKLLVRSSVAADGIHVNLNPATGMADGASRVAVAATVTTESMRHAGITSTGTAVPATTPGADESFLSVISAIMVAGATPSGNIQVRVKTETAGTTLTVKAGSFIRYREIT